MTIASVLSYVAFKLLVPALFTLSVAAFLWGTFLFIIAGAQDEELQEKGKAVMLYGLIVFAVMTAVFAILRIIGASLSTVF